MYADMCMSMCTHVHICEGEAESSPFKFTIRSTRYIVILY